jgi:hypothetical protein
VLGVRPPSARDRDVPLYSLIQEPVGVSNLSTMYPGVAVPGVVGACHVIVMWVLVAAALTSLGDDGADVLCPVVEEGVEPLVVTTAEPVVAEGVVVASMEM